MRKVLWGGIVVLALLMFGLSPLTSTAAEAEWKIMYEGTEAYNAQTSIETTMTGTITAVAIYPAPAPEPLPAPTPTTRAGVATGQAPASIPASLYRLDNYVIRCDASLTYILQAFLNTKVEVTAKIYRDQVILDGGTNAPKPGAAPAPSIENIIIGKIRPASDTTPTDKILQITSYWTGEQSSFETASEQLITSNDAWKTFWSKTNNYIYPTLYDTAKPVDEATFAPMPNYDWTPVVDFSSSMVIAVTMGQKSSGGYAIAITGVKLGADGVITAEVVRRSPSPDSMTTAVMTSPYCAVVVEKANGTLKVVYKDEVTPESVLHVSPDSAVISVGEDYYFYAWEEVSPMPVPPVIYYAMVGKKAIIGETPTPTTLPAPTPLPPVEGDPADPNAGMPAPPDFMPPLYQFKWSSSDENVAVVDMFGKVTGTGVGEAIITAVSTSSGKSGSAKVTVLKGSPAPPKYGTYYVPNLIHNNPSVTCWLVVSNITEYDSATVELTAVSETGEQIGNKRRLKVAPNATQILQLSDRSVFGEGLLFGAPLPDTSIWLGIHSDNQAVQYFVFYQGVAAESLGELISVPVCSYANQLTAPLVVNHDQYNTYFSLVNPSAKTNTVEIKAFDFAGVEIGSAKLELNSAQQIIVGTAGLIPAIKEQPVRIRITGSEPLAGNFMLNDTKQKKWTIFAMSASGYYYPIAYDGGVPPAATNTEGAPR